MKRFCFLITILCIVWVVFPFHVIAAEEEITVYVNDVEIIFDQPPILENHRTLVPFRAIFDALGAWVSWDNETKIVSANWGEDGLTIPIGSKEIHLYSGKTVVLDVPARIENGRTLVPLRAVVECIKGTTVDWDGSTKTIHITMPKNTVFINSTKGLLKEIASNTELLLAPGTYDLSEELIQGKEDGSFSENPYLYLAEVFDGTEVQISGITNFSISAQDPSQKTEIITKPRYANVLSFINCKNISLSNLTLGHSPEQGYCLGGVIYLCNAKNINLNQLDLYGCGTFGITAEGVEKLNCVNTNIRDCTYGIMDLSSCNNFTFQDCKFFRCREYSLLDLKQSTSIIFNTCTFMENKGTFLNLQNHSNVLFTNCTMEDAVLQELMAKEGFGNTIIVT